MNKLLRIIESMDREDLVKLKKDLEEGNMGRIIQKRMDELNDENHVCPVCNKPAKSDDYVLEFGKAGLRMKARFDGLDCLEHFTKRLQKGPSVPSFS